MDFPTVQKQPDGTTHVVPYVFDAASMAVLEQGETDFRAKRYAEASAQYRKALEVSPANYLAWSYLGDCALYQGQGAEALADYDRALELNPFDYRLWFYKGDALLQTREVAQAYDAWAMSLVLNPRNAGLIARLGRTPVGLTVFPEMLHPRSFARREGEEVAVYSPAKDQAWLIYGLCKALWIGEPAHRQEMGAGGGWSSVEEHECLANLIAVYESSRGKAGFVADSDLDRLVKTALGDRELEEAILYEIGSRIDPQITLGLNDRQRELVRRYVLTHVIVPTER
jgi:tetratricopeptide (TPR) repeat protein